MFDTHQLSLLIALLKPGENQTMTHPHIPYLITYNDAWFDVPSVIPIPFVCELPQTNSTCPDDTWYSFVPTRSCYKKGATAAPYPLARMLCAVTAPGAHLVSITSELENLVVWKVCGDGAHSCWIGLHESKGSPDEPTWQWEDGSDVSYTHWMPGQPDNHVMTINGTQIPDAVMMGVDLSPLVNDAIRNLILLIIIIYWALQVFGLAWFQVILYRKPCITELPLRKEKESDAFNERLCGCCDNRSICLTSCCCCISRSLDTYVSLGIIGRDTGPTAWILSLLLAPLYCVVGRPVMRLRVRGQLVGRKSADGQDTMSWSIPRLVEDVLVSWLCCCCALSQEAREADKLVNTEMDCCGRLGVYGTKAPIGDPVRVRPANQPP